MHAALLLMAFHMLFFTPDFRRKGGVGCALWESGEKNNSVNTGRKGLSEESIPVTRPIVGMWLAQRTVPAYIDCPLPVRVGKKERKKKTGVRGVLLRVDIIGFVSLSVSLSFLLFLTV